jgi:hypothetical protein
MYAKKCYPLSTMTMTIFSYSSSAEHMLVCCSSVLGTSSHKDRVKKRMVASTPITNSRTEIEGKQSVVAQQEDKISFPSKNCQGVRTSDYSGNSKKSCTSCDVCGMSTSKISNKLLSCGRCPVKVKKQLKTRVICYCLNQL